MSSSHESAPLPDAMEADTARAAAAPTDGAAAAPAEAEPPVAITLGGEGAAGPLQVLLSAQGDMSLNRAPATSEEFTRIIFTLINDANTRMMDGDPMWRKQLRTLPAYDRVATDPAACLEIQRAFYEYLFATHDRLLTKRFVTQRCAAAIRPGKAARALIASRDKTVVPVGCGDEYAVALFATDGAPDTYQLGAALLTCDRVVTVDDLAREHGASAVTPEMVDAQCTPAYVIRKNFVLRDVVVLHACIHAHTVTVVYAPKTAAGATLEVAVYDVTSDRGVVVPLAGTRATDRYWRVACNGTFLAFAYTGDGLAAPTSISVFLVEAPAAGAMVFALPSRATPDASARPSNAVIASLAFDVAHPDRLCVCTAEREMTSMVLPRYVAATDGTLAQYQATFVARAAATAFTRCTTPTPAQELAITEMFPQLPKGVSLREEPRAISTAVGHGGRVVILSANNLFAATVLAHSREAPDISTTLAATGGYRLGTLPNLWLPGLGHAVSAATAGNALLVHLFDANRVVLFDLRSQQAIHVLMGSQELGHEPARANVGAPEGDEQAAPPAEADPFVARSIYQSCWATLERLVVQMPTGDLMVYEPLK